MEPVVHGWIATTYRSSITPGPGAEIAVFGYPLGDVLGGGVKFTAGAISAPPDKGRGDVSQVSPSVVMILKRTQ